MDYFNVQVELQMVIAEILVFVFDQGLGFIENFEDLDQQVEEDAHLMVHTLQAIARIAGKLEVDFVEVHVQRVWSSLGFVGSFDNPF